MLRNRSEILEQLKQVLRSADESKAAIIEACTEEANLATDLGLSSVGLLYVVISIEEQFGIRFENVGIADFVTVRDVVDYIEGRSGTC